MNRNFDPMIFLVYKNCVVPAEKGMNQRKCSGGEGEWLINILSTEPGKGFIKKRKVKNINFIFCRKQNLTSIY